MTRVSKCFRSSKTTTALHPSQTLSPLYSPYSTTHRVMPRGSTSFTRASRGISRFSFSHSSVTIPPILQVMLFLRAIHPCYEGLLNQFASKHKDLSTASIDSILSDAKNMDGFIPVGAKGKPVLTPLLIAMARIIALPGSGWRHSSLATFQLVGAAL